VAAFLPEEPTPTFESGFARLQAQFVAGLSQRRTDIDNANPAELEWELHRLAGAAASFGFGTLGELARRAEQHIHSSDHKADDPLLRSILSELRQHIDEIVTVR
jgi:HPt (histidine-containing phosphotransfer) domain-containing protein